MEQENNQDQINGETATQTDDNGAQEAADQENGKGQSENEVELYGEKITVPDQFFDKDKKQVNLKALLKSQSDLRRQVSQVGKTPEKYAFADLDEKNDALLIKALDGFGHAEKIGQDKMDGLVGLLKAASEEYRGGMESETKAEFARLFADKAEKTARETQNWLNGLIGTKAADDPELKEFVDSVAESPYAVWLVDALRQAVKTKNVSPQTANPAGTSGKKTEEELDAMVADPRYDKDPAYRKKVEEAFAATFGA